MGSQTCLKIIINCLDVSDYDEDLAGREVIKVTEWVDGQPTIGGRGAPLFLPGGNKVIESFGKINLYGALSLDIAKNIARGVYILTAVNQQHQYNFKLMIK